MESGDPRKRLVQAGYDRLGERYLRWSAEVEGDPRECFVDELVRALPAGAPVLDLGCGGGLPTTRFLAERMSVTGVDISNVQLRMARQNVPKATFVQADFSELTVPGGAFAAVTALYSLSHVPREEHAGLFQRIAHWLVPDGLLLATLGVEGTGDWAGDWLGVPMFFSSWDAATNRMLLRAAGFELLHDVVVEMNEPDGPATFLWVLARTAR